MSAHATPTMGHRIAAEFVGTFVLVFGGCGSAVLAAAVLAPTPSWGTSASGSSASPSPSVSPSW